MQTPDKAWGFNCITLPHLMTRYTRVGTTPKHHNAPGAKDDTDEIVGLDCEPSPLASFSGLIICTYAGTNINTPAEYLLKGRVLNNHK